MASRQARQNIQKVGPQHSAPKDIETRPDTSSESKHSPKHSPTSTAPSTEACHDRGRERKRAQESQDAPAKRCQDGEQENPIPLPSTSLNKPPRGEKRRHSRSPHISESYTSKRPRLSQAIQNPVTIESYNPIEYWVVNGNWPEDYIQRGLIMSEVNPKKRKSESTHRSDRLKRLAENGVFMNSSSLIQKSSKDFCHGLMNGDRQPAGHCPFPPEQLLKVLERVRDLNKSRIQRDVTPWVVPSAEVLFYCGELNANFIGDEVNAEWTRCATMGSTRPKPNYVAGLLPSAFTTDEIQTLRNYASPSRPVFFTPDLCFPFLICEVKTGEVGLNAADRQNIHSASIAVKGVIELFKTAFGDDSERVKDLYGQVLVFTVSHDHDKVCLYGHYAAISEADKLQYYRHRIAFIFLSDDEDKFAAYNFVYNVYTKFAPVHQKRIQDASAQLRRIQKQTTLSFTASESASEDANSHADSQDTRLQDDPDFKTPGPSASSMRGNEVIRLRGQLELQRSEMKALQEQMERRIEQQREQMERQMEQQREQMERQMEQQREQMERQMEQQREQMERQMEQQREQMEQQREQMEQQREQMERQMEHQREQLALQKELLSLLRQQREERVP